MTAANKHQTKQGLALAGNEPRAELLFQAIKRIQPEAEAYAFDPISPLTRYVAAACSFSLPRSEWWSNYQMHPLVQRARAANLSKAIRSGPRCPDTLFMWGSWFLPRRTTPEPMSVYFYIDQSHSLLPNPGEPLPLINRRRRAWRLQDSAYKQCAAVFTMSEWARAQTLASHGLSPDNVINVGWGPYAIDLSGEPLDSTKDRFVVLHVSNDFHRKGLDFLMEVAEKFSSSTTALVFHVIGEDVGGSRPRDTHNVRFLGKVTDRARLAEHFRQASVFFLPHRFDRSPHVLIEAMSAGLPLVASAQGGALELTSGTGAGFHVPVGDIDGYVHAIQTLNGNPDLVREMGAVGKRLVRTKYNWDLIAERILTMIRSRNETFAP